MFQSDMLRVGSPLISRAGWVALLEAQGFHSCVVAGSAAAAPPLLARQSVVVGVSDGVVRLSTGGRARADAASSSKAANAALPLQSVKRDDMLQARCAASARHIAWCRTRGSIPYCLQLQMHTGTADDLQHDWPPRIFANSMHRR